MFFIFKHHIFVKSFKLYIRNICLICNLRVLSLCLQVYMFIVQQIKFVLKYSLSGHSRPKSCRKKYSSYSNLQVCLVLVVYYQNNICIFFVLLKLFAISLPVLLSHATAAISTGRFLDFLQPLKIRKINLSFLFNQSKSSLRFIFRSP